MLQFEHDLSCLARSNGHSGDIAKSSPPFKMRLCSLYYRCRLITLDESVRMCGLLDTLAQSSHHTSTLLLGLREITITQSVQNTIKIQSSIAECETRNLKRLEVELRLIQLSFHLILKSLGSTSGVDINDSLEKVRQTCTQYPDSAGIFYPHYESLKKSCEGVPSGQELYSNDGRELWQLWGQFEPGHTDYCIFGHPYSGKTFSACPECGRKVVKARKSEAIDYNKFLHENAFIEYMMKMQPTIKV